MGSRSHARRGNFESEEGRSRTGPDMSGHRRTQRNSAGGSTGTVRMPIANWGVLDGGAHWRHPANTNEASMCSSNATLCQVTVTTLLLGEEASPSIGNTLWRVSTMFTRSAITPPEVDGCG